MTQHNQTRWWGTFRLDQGQTARWQIGPLKLAIKRRPYEWQIAHEQDMSLDPDTGIWDWDPAAPDLDELNYAHTARFVFDQTHELLTVTPLLADRPMVTRPVQPLYVPADETTTIFVSSPLWVNLQVEDPPKKLHEIPIIRPSDTWFGPSTMEGELTYASRTNARLNLENIPIRSHRTITQILIQNRADSQLSIERLSLPVPYLSLFETEDGLLWTQAVTLERTRKTGLAAFQIETGPLAPAQSAKLISGPRQQPEQNMVIRAFGTIFR